MKLHRKLQVTTRFVILTRRWWRISPGFSEECRHPAWKTQVQQWWSRQWRRTRALWWLISLPHELAIYPFKEAWRICLTFCCAETIVRRLHWQTEFCSHWGRTCQIETSTLVRELVVVGDLSAWNKNCAAPHRHLEANTLLKDMTAQKTRCRLGAGCDSHAPTSTSHQFKILKRSADRAFIRSLLFWEWWATGDSELAASVQITLIFTNSVVGVDKDFVGSVESEFSICSCVTRTYQPVLEILSRGGLSIPRSTYSSTFSPNTMIPHWFHKGLSHAPVWTLTHTILNDAAFSSYLSQSGLLR